MKNEVVARAEAIIAKKEGTGNDGYCAVITIDENGYPMSSTVSVSKADGIRWLTLGTELGSGKVSRISKCNRVCVCFNSAEYHISLVGTVEVQTDPQAKQNAWYDKLKHHFSGVDDPNYCVLRFTTERYSIFFTDGEADDDVLPTEGTND